MIFLWMLLRDRIKTNCTLSEERDASDAVQNDEGIVKAPIPEEFCAADGASQPSESVQVVFIRSLTASSGNDLQEKLLQEEEHILREAREEERWIDQEQEDDRLEKKRTEEYYRKKRLERERIEKQLDRAREERRRIERRIEERRRRDR